MSQQEEKKLGDVSTMKFPVQALDSALPQVQPHLQSVVEAYYKFKTAPSAGDKEKALADLQESQNRLQNDLIALIDARVKAALDQTGLSKN